MHVVGQAERCGPSVAFDGRPYCAGRSSSGSPVFEQQRWSGRGTTVLSSLAWPPSSRDAPAPSRDRSALEDFGSPTKSEPILRLRLPWNLRQS
jgi:hypothetical protein